MNRLSIFPFYKDYINHSNEFRPFVTSFGECNYKSGSLNTDEFGLRRQFYKNGEKVDFKTIKFKINECDLLLGGSTAFGTGCSSDKTTFANLLTKEGNHLINWGQRGALSQQELLTFLMLKPFLPKIKKIILFSGANDVSLSAIEGNFTHPEWGTVFSEKYFAEKAFHKNNEKNTKKEEFKIFKLIKFFNSFSFSQNKEVNLNKKNLIKIDLNVPKYETVLHHIKNSFETWSWIQNTNKLPIIYILQPVATWSKKRLSKIEEKLINSDIESIAGLNTFLCEMTYYKFKKDLEKLAKNFNIKFIDLNKFLRDSNIEDQLIFIDSCHLTDRGNIIICELLKKAIY